VLAVAAGIALAAGQSWQTGLIVGGVLAMSSTAIVSKTLSEQAQLHTPAGRQIMGVLLFQDLAVIPLLVFIPALALPPDALAGAMGIAVAKAAVVLALVLFIGQRVMRPLFNVVAKQKSSELFVLFVLLVTLASPGSRSSRACRSRWAPSWPACSSPRPSTATRSRTNQALPRRASGLLLRDDRMLLEPAVVVGRWQLVALVLVALLALKFVVIHGSPAPSATRSRRPSLRASRSPRPAKFGFVLLAPRGQGIGAGPAHAPGGARGRAPVHGAHAVLMAKSERIVLYFVESEWTQRAMALHQLAVKTMPRRGT